MHILQPKHIKLSEEDTEKFLNKLNISRAQLPKILSTDAALPESCNVEYVQDKMKEHDIEMSVVLASYFPHKTSGISNFRLYNWVRDKPEFKMFGSLDFENYFFQGMNELTELGQMDVLSGIKIYTGYQNIDLNGNKMQEVIKLAKKQNVPMAFHCGYSHSALRKYGKPAITDLVSPKDLENLARENPEINFLACHMAKPYFEDTVKITQRTKNIYTDMSGLLHSGPESDELEEVTQEVKKYLELAGPSKLMFGTDFPVQTHEDSIYIIENAMKYFDERDKQDVYYNNARRFLKNE